MISFIIAAYNAQNYIESCIESCLSLKDFPSEIILVNDGSTDDTPNICERLKNGYENITVINQENKGVSAARNVGLNKAKGDWVFFIDADDTINSVELIKVLNKLSTDWNDINICTFGSNFIYKSQTEIHNVAGKSYKTKDFLNSALFQLATWSYLFRRKFLVTNKIYFPEGIICTEDQNFNLKALCCCDKIISFNNIIYNYNCTNQNSASKKVHSSEWIKSRLKSANDLLYFCTKHSINTDIVLNQVKRLYESYMNDNTTNISFSSKKEFYVKEYMNTVAILPKFKKIRKLYICKISFELGSFLFYLHRKLVSFRG